MAQDSQPTTGITADGRFVEFGDLDDDLADQIVCGMDSDGDIIHCAEIQPMEFIEENWYEPFDFDEALFANYGKDWWLGVLYKPARLGLLGGTARSNVTEAGDAIYAGFQTLRRNQVGAYMLLRQMARIALGIDEHEAEIEECLSGDPEQLQRFRELNALIDHQMGEAVQLVGQRGAGGAFVGFALRRIRVPRRFLNGASAPTRYGTYAGEFAAKMTLNFVLAGWGSMLRSYINMTQIREVRTQYATSWTPGRPPSPIEMLSAAIFWGQACTFRYQRGNS